MEVTIGVELGVSVRVYMCRLASVSAWIDVYMCGMHGRVHGDPNVYIDMHLHGRGRRWVWLHVGVCGMCVDACVQDMYTGRL